MIGRTLSHYRILEQIGAGGMGVVYRAHDERLDRDVALKVLSPGLADDKDFLARFRREALTLSKLNHPNIATVHDFDTDGGTSFLVMELIQGISLATKARSGPLKEKDVIRLGLQLLEGLCAAHAEGIIHRDLKPSNLSETLDGRLKILDFGLARILQSDLNVTQSLVTTTGMVGTLPYMAPEQLRGKSIDASADIYSSGVVLYELATAHRPFPEPFAPKLIDSILHQKPLSPRELNPQLSRKIEQIILKSLEKQPEKRFCSAEEMRNALEQTQTAVLAELTESVVSSQAPPMEIAHVLFTDIVGYSKLAMEEQQRQLRQLQKLVRATVEFERAKAQGQLVSLPTGDGMALVFFGEPESAARCAVQLSTSLRAYPDIKLRMGVNNGPVYRMADINANRNVAGGGINIAQRVMDCGDANHILISKAVADVLGQLSAWRGLLHDLGEVEVKHGVLIHIYNLYTSEVGNPALPKKVLPSAFWWRPYALGLGALLILSIIIASLLSKPAEPNRRHDPEQPIERLAVAVMGFQNISNHRDEDWISTSLSEDLITELAASQKLRAVSAEEVTTAKTDLALPNGSSFSSETLRKIRKRLNSDYVISGAYLAEGSGQGDALRIDFRLQNAKTGDITDAMQLSGTVGDLPGLIKQTSGAMLSKLVTGNSQEAQSLNSSSAPTVNLAAKRSYAQGLEKLRRFEPLSARDLFQRALAAEPNFANAHSALAEAWSELGYDKNAEEESRKAFEHSGDLPVETRKSIEGRYYRFSSQWDKAINLYRSLQGVYTDEPAYALNLADVQTRAGKGKDALATLNELKNNPLFKDDARIDLREAYAASALSDLPAQQRAAASAAQKASKNHSEFLAAEAYWLECSAFFALGQPQKAETSCRKSMQAATSAPVYMARSQTVLASILESEGKTSQAMELRLGALRTARDIHSNQDIIGALMNLANLLESEGQAEEAQKKYLEAFGVANEIGDKQHLMDLQSDMAANLSAHGQLEDAQRGYELTLKTAKEIGDLSGIAIAYQNLGLVLLQMGELPTAKHNIQQSTAISTKAGLKSIEAFSTSLYGDLLMAEGKLAESQKSNEAALKIYAELKMPSGVADCQVSLANLAIENDNLAKAESLIRLAITDYQQEKLVAQEADARNTLARTLLLQGKPLEASTELNDAERLAGQNPITRVSLETTRARILSRAGKLAEANGTLNKAFVEAVRLHLVGEQFEIRLARLEMGEDQTRQVDTAELRKLQKDARQAGYMGIVRRATELQQ